MPQEIPPRAESFEPVIGLRVMLRHDLNLKVYKKYAQPIFKIHKDTIYKIFYIEKATPRSKKVTFLWIGPPDQEIGDFSIEKAQRDALEGDREYSEVVAIPIIYLKPALLH